MLLRFGVSNHRSIRNYAELSFVAADAIKDQGPKLLTWSGAKTKVLPALVIYGANAAGKSSLHMAYGAMRSHIINSFQKSEVNGKIPRNYFALDKTSCEEKTRFDCDFVIDNIRYHYGFEFDDVQFHREWLYSFPEGHRRMLFNRDSENDDIEFGKYLKGRNKSISELLRPNSLFISVAAQSAHAQLSTIYEFFLTDNVGLGAGLNDSAIQRKIGVEADPRLVPFLNCADFGISDLQVREAERDEVFVKTYQALRATMMAEAGEEVASQTDEVPKPTTEVSFLHNGADGDTYELPFAKESRGTRRLSHVVLSAFKVLDSGGVLFVDEIDASLHTLLSLKVISLFLNEKTNPHGAQIVAVTHDTNILCAGVLRRDQIWFAEKGDDGGTHVYPLTDIKTRNTDNIEKGYLQGRFGAVPYFGDVVQLFQSEDYAAA